MHFIPTHSSWLNLVERWFAEITSKRIRRESWQSVQELEKGIMDFIHNWNETEKKYVWIKTATQIRASINEAKKRYADYTKLILWNTSSVHAEAAASLSPCLHKMHYNQHL